METKQALAEDPSEQRQGHSQTPDTFPVRISDPFINAAVVLSALCDRLDDGEPLTAAFIEIFGEAKLVHAEQIDERKAQVTYVTSMMELARAKRAEMDAYVQRLKAIEVKLKESTRDAMVACPDLPWRDTVGKKLSLCRNSQPSLKLEFDVRESKTVTNVIDSDVIDLLGIPRDYVKPVGFLCLDTEKLKADLKAGLKVEWASIETGLHTRGW